MEWAISVGIFLAGLLSGYTIKVVVDLRVNTGNRALRSDAHDRSVAQTGNKAGGHIAGRDVNVEN